MILWKCMWDKGLLQAKQEVRRLEKSQQTDRESPHTASHDLDNPLKSGESRGLVSVTMTAQRKAVLKTALYFQL